ncbi:hypothetical protein VSU19_19320 [Verrucomicrobiales bacterium BCK34]|nr:hypothetical protein [Verrucomicrobiales bacterium BCK34]
MSRVVLWFAEITTWFCSEAAGRGSHRIERGGSTGTSLPTFSQTCSYGCAGMRQTLFDFV